MSTGKLKQKVQYIERLSEDNFHLLTENSDYSTVIMGQEEPYWTNRFIDRELGPNLIKDFVAKAKQENFFPDIKMVVCGYDYQDDAFSKHDITAFDKNIPWAERVQWGTYWFGYTVALELRHNPPMPPIHKPVKLFSCFLNNGYKAHRVAMMQSLIDNDMMEKGIIRYCNNHNAWRDFLGRVNKQMEVGGPHRELFYKLLPHLPKIFSQKRWGVKGPGITDVGFDDDYHLGAIDIIGASNTDTITYCEKTARPLMYGKPFYIVGPPNTNVRLRDLGFELYDEIFDYTKDNLIHPNKITSKDRVDYYNDMLEPLYKIEASQESIDHILEITKEKTLYNQKRFVEIIFDDSYIPYVFPDRVDNYFYDVSISWPRRMLANSVYFKPFLTKEQKRMYSD